MGESVLLDLFLTPIFFTDLIITVEIILIVTRNIKHIFLHKQIFCFQTRQPCIRPQTHKRPCLPFIFAFLRYCFQVILVAVYRLHVVDPSCLFFIRYTLADTFSFNAQLSDTYHVFEVNPTLNCTRTGPRLAPP